MRNKRLLSLRENIRDEGKIQILSEKFFDFIESHTHDSFFVSSTDVNDNRLPNDINVTFQTDTNTSTKLSLKRVDHITSNVPIYTIDTDEEGVKIKKENIQGNENVAFYQDTKNDAVFQISRLNDSVGQTEEFIITRGEYRYGNVSYLILPAVRSKRQTSEHGDQSDFTSQRYDVMAIKTPTERQTDFLTAPPEFDSFENLRVLSKRFQDGAKSSRRKRQTISTYYVDVAAYLDYTCYSRFLTDALYDEVETLKKIQEYYAFIFSGIDLIYQNFEANNIRLRVNLNKVLIFKSSASFRLFYIYSYSYKVDTMSVLNNFTTFLNSTAGRDFSFPYDHAMLFVGSDLWTLSVDILGLAWVETLCRTDGVSSSVIEDMGDYSAIFTGAHELGHSLASDHDGVNNTCTYKDRYLMSPSLSKPTDSTRQHPWRFSNCSVASIYYYVTTLALAPLNSPQLGCGYYNGNPSYSSSTTLRTTVKFTTTQSTMTTRPPTTKGNWCYDNVNFSKYGLSCQQLYSYGYCFNQDVQTYCCSSCNQGTTTITTTPSCKYGDEYRSLCSNIMSCDGYEDFCCQTCGNGTSTLTTKTTCTQRPPTTTHGCEFGDKYRSMCPSLLSCDGNHNVCYPVLFLTNAFHLTFSISVYLNISSTDVNDNRLPNDINVTFQTDTNTSTELNLKRVDHITSNVPIYTIDTDEEGVKIKKEDVQGNENVAFYQDTQNDAVIQVSRLNGSEGLTDYIVTRGEYRRGQVRYSILPAVRNKRQTSEDEDQSGLRSQRYDVRPIETPTERRTDFMFAPPERQSFKSASSIIKKLEGGDNSTRRNRQTITTYYIDVTAVLDYSRYSQFLDDASLNETVAQTKIKEYYAFIFSGIDLIYQNFAADNVRLRVNLNKVLIFKTSASFELVYMSNVSAVSGKVDTGTVLSNLTKFLSSAAGRDFSFPYDYAMLFVGSDLWNGETNILGLAWVKTLCRSDGYSSSVIEDKGDYSAILTGAHELGHSLASYHDGESNNCTFDDGYLMASSNSAPTDSTRQHPWRFSNCSVSYIVTFITSLASTT
ncbi:hypothetical protein Btru_059760, partial [Bulinus truncatus]